ncbi:MAG: HesA/MoeB/ThiF family protein, partial [Alphaproteobacteria bacterium]|nr:HesA/MoeB/ThiF family protein [Alphaproteobacteria bacterium]
MNERAPGTAPEPSPLWGEGRVRGASKPTCAAGAPPSDRRYARQTVLPEIGEGGQAKLAASKVLVIGAGGLGSPALLYLAAAGVGTLGIVDHDQVELSNLQRQILFETSDIGRKKSDAASDALADLNPDIRIEPHATRLTADNAHALFAPYDLILDGSDNLTTRYAVNDACAYLGKPLISAAVQGFEGQLYVFPFQNPEDPC